jgi:SAM-dependent methyltransferase
MVSEESWLNTTTGRNLLREEVRQVRKSLESVFGDQFVQLGVWGDAGLFRRLARTRRAAVVAATPSDGVDFVSALECAAIASESIDAVLLPHTLELALDPHAVLREVDRMLRSDGQLIVLGFNPWGWWGWRHRLSRQGFPPGSARLISDGRLSDWLRLLDFRVHHAAFYYFVPPLIRGDVRYRRAAQRPDDTPPAAQSPAARAPGGRLWLSSGAAAAGALVRRIRPLAAAYVLVARRQTHAVTPIRLAWRRRTRVVAALVNPTTRSAA